MTTESQSSVPIEKPRRARGFFSLARDFTGLGCPGTDRFELRSDSRGSVVDPKRLAVFLADLPVERFFDAMAVRLNGEEADGKRYAFTFVFTDVGATAHLARHPLVRLDSGEAKLKDLVMSDDLLVDAFADDGAGG